MKDPLMRPRTFLHTTLIYLIPPLPNSVSNGFVTVMKAVCQDKSTKTAQLKTELQAGFPLLWIKTILINIKREPDVKITLRSQVTKHGLLGIVEIVLICLSSL